MIHKIPTDQTILKGDKIKPGDTVVLSGTYPVAPYCKDLVFVTFTNEGPVHLQSGFKFDGCRNIRLLGSQSEQFRISEPTKDRSGIQIYNRSTDIEIAYILISEIGFAGIMCKDDGASRASNFTMRNIHIHHCVIENTGGEGMYIGATKSEGHDLVNVHVHHNTLKKIGWDGMQFGNVVSGLDVHDNNISVTGTNIHRKEDEVQDNGLQIGQRSKGKVYKNKIVDARGNAIIAMGTGCDIFENELFRAGESGIFSDTRPDSTEPNRFRNNRILLPVVYGIAIRDTYKKGFKSTPVHNMILNPGKGYFSNGNDIDKHESNNFTDMNLLLAEHFMKKP